MHEKGKLKADLTVKRHFGIKKGMLYVSWYGIFITLHHLLFPFIISRK